MSPQISGVAVADFVARVAGVAQELHRAVPSAGYTGYMANQFALNTADHPTLVQVLFATREGLFDYKTQQAAGKVTVAANKSVLARKAREIKDPKTGKPYLSES